MARNLGPVLAGTVIVPDLDFSIDAYCEWLEMSVAEKGVLSKVLTDAWRMPQLQGTRQAILVSESGNQWIRFIEDVSSKPCEPISTLGWMALEVLVSDVYDLAKRLENSVFRFIGKPAPLDVSPAISACQVVGPAGEVLYLTSVSEPVPPFELPTATAYVDKLFIPVLAVPDQSKSMAFYEKLAGSTALAFDTKVTVVNNALGRDVNQKLPVCTIQLDGESLIEIDAVPEFPPRAASSSNVINGLIMVSFHVQSLEGFSDYVIGSAYSLKDGFYKECEAALLRGPSGELIELIKT